MSLFKRSRRWAPNVALPITLCFAWSFCLGPVVEATTRPAVRPKGEARRLTSDEMRRIVGMQSYAPGTDPSPGTSYGWEGSYDTTSTGDGSNSTVNTGNGNKRFTTSLVAWTAKGGMPVNFSLTHNSMSARDAEVGHKWTHSYDIFLYWDFTAGKLTIHWGDDRAYQFTENVDGSFTPPVGIYDTLETVGTDLRLTTKDQLKYYLKSDPASANHFWCTSITDPNGNVITINRNPSDYGKVTSVVDPTNRTLTITHTNGRISAITDPMSRQWSLSYTNGELTQVTWPIVSGNTYSEGFAYDTGGAHLITTYTDKRGKNWTFGYTGLAISWEKDPLLNETSYSYQGSPERFTITDPNGKTLVHEYDSSGRLSSEKDALNYVESYQWDSSNNRTQVTTRRGKVWVLGYDTRGNCTSVTNPLSKTTETTFNSKNRPLTTTFPSGHQVVNTYDTTLNWRLTQTQRKHANGTVINTTSFTYNSDGTVDTKTDSNSHVTDYGYNTHGHLTSLETPNGRVWAEGLNTLGVRNSRTDALNRTTTYTLDNWHRPTGSTYPDSSTRSFSFDANSNLTGWTDPHGTWSRTYDDANRLTNESLNSVTRFSYSYDATGKKGLLSSMSDAAGRTFTYSYTDRKQLASVTETPGSLTAAYSYNEDGAETGITNPNSTTVTRVFDDASRLTSVTNKNSSNVTLSSFTYGYNDDDLRTSCTESDGSVVSYGYDGAHRLTSESRTGTNAYSKTYVLDGTGNRTVNEMRKLSQNRALKTEPPSC